MSAANELNINVTHVERIAKELGLRAIQVGATAKLFADGGTVPFIARYRKEATGSLDEVQIQNIQERMTQLVALDDRRTAIVKSLEERKLMTDVLRGKIEKAETINALEDIFAPFRPKRRTRATIAKEKGLEPLADFIEANLMTHGVDLTGEVAKFVNPDHENEELRVKDAADALSGARDIIAERISDHADARATLRKFFAEQSTVVSKVMFGKEKDEEAQKFRDYFDWSEPLKAIPSHRMLAIRRGEKEGFLLMRIQPAEDTAVKMLETLFVKGGNLCSDQMKLACADSYKRLMSSSMETEARLESKKKADTEAVRVFADNLRELLLAAPLGQKRVLGIDPGFRTGCKVVVLDAQGQLLYNDVIYLLGEGSGLLHAKNLLLNLIDRYKIQAIAIGNGTAGRETEMFVKKIGVPASVPVIMVNESGASIYSASEAAREEFPDQDLTVRGSVSIARRLMDPLAELVKLDPK
ncbi:MAG: RNA-binding transcriptional accessory protein, partial [Prosthecobacter sp.]|nr:RNA-binding transcriptional accessory protein [Prosthecobacter sp.]